MSDIRIERLSIRSELLGAPVEITLLEHEDAAVFGEHIIRHMRESGRNGSPIFSPRSADQLWDAKTRLPVITARWQKALADAGWERVWGLWDEGRIVGHVDLTTLELPSASHRATLSMGIEAQYRAKGAGSRMLDTVISWAKDNTQLEWLDLGVFANNEPARKLYRKFGFVEVGRTKDAFRVEGHSLENIQMVLKLAR